MLICTRFAGMPKVLPRNAANAGALPHCRCLWNPHVQQNQARVGSARRVDRVFPLSARRRGARLLVADVDTPRRRRSVERRNRAGRRRQPGDRAAARRAHQPVACRHAHGARRPEARGHHPPCKRFARRGGQGVRPAERRAARRRGEPRACRGARRALPQDSHGARGTRAVPRHGQHPGISRSADARYPGCVPDRAAPLRRLRQRLEPYGARDDRRRHGVVQVGEHRAVGRHAGEHRGDLRRGAPVGRRRSKRPAATSNGLRRAGSTSRCARAACSRST